MTSVELSLSPRNCPVCASSDNSRLYAESNVDLRDLGQFAFASRKLPEFMHWRLLECTRCDLVYASPAPAAETLASLYEEAAFDSVREAGYAARTYAGLLPIVKRRLSNLRGALDIGTGDGAFLEELLHAGFTDVAGVEPSSAPINAATREVQPLIRHGVFRSGDFQPESFALVTCFQTIEHLADPMAIVRDIYRILKPGGAALIVAHNRRAASARILGRHSPIFDVEHLQLFSPRSLDRLMTAAGFVDMQVGSLLNRYPVSYWARLTPLPRGIKSRLIGAMNGAGIGRFVLPLPAGNIYVVALKPARGDAAE